jgi:selenocysteine lyase/cysteine desulfurase
LTYRKGAARFECGTLNTAGIYGLKAAIDLFLEVGPERVEEHLLDLSGYLAGCLESRGYEVISSREPAELSGIVACRHGSMPASNVCRRLREVNVITAPRIGRLRISPHFYNTRDEIDTLIAALPD